MEAGGKSQKEEDLEEKARNKRRKVDHIKPMEEPYEPASSSSSPRATSSLDGQRKVGRCLVHYYHLNHLRVNPSTFVCCCSLSIWANIHYCREEEVAWNPSHHPRTRREVGPMSSTNRIFVWIQLHPPGRLTLCMTFLDFLQRHPHRPSRIAVPSSRVVTYRYDMRTKSE